MHTEGNAEKHWALVVRKGKAEAKSGQQCKIQNQWFNLRSCKVRGCHSWR